MSLYTRLAKEFTADSNPHQFATPGDLATHLNTRTIQTPALELIDDELLRCWDTPDARLAISMPPQEGKSERCSRTFPLWVLLAKPETRIAIASYSDTAARRFSRRVRDDIRTHTNLGLRVRQDLANQSEWQLQNHAGGVYAVGMGGSLTGRPVDLLIIDDPVKDRAEADSLAYRERAWDWWTEVGSTRLAPGAPVVVIQTRWHQDDLTGRLLTADDGHLWRVINLPAQAEDDDQLGRAPGEYLISSRGRTEAQWEAIKIRSGSRTWNALYQGRPAPSEGGILQRSWWRQYPVAPWIMNEDSTRTLPNATQILTSWDMAFKANSNSDFVVGQVWARRGGEALLLDQIRARLTFTETISAVRTLAARWPQANLHLVEDAANGTAIIDTLRRSLPGIVPVTPHESKEARASAISPWVEAGNVILPSPMLAPWVGDLIEEAAAFPNGTHDDQVDAMSQALTRLLAGGTATTYLQQLAPACITCGMPVPRSAQGVCRCGAIQPDVA